MISWCFFVAEVGNVESVRFQLFKGPCSAWPLFCFSVSRKAYPSCCRHLGWKLAYSLFEPKDHALSDIRMMQGQSFSQRGSVSEHGASVVASEKTNNEDVSLNTVPHSILFAKWRSFGGPKSVPVVETWHFSTAAKRGNCNGKRKF